MAAAEQRYEAYGLAIASDLEMPELAPGDRACEPDLRIRFGDVPDVPGAGWARWHVDPGAARLAYDEVARIAVLDGAEIVVEPLGERPDVHLYVAGPALALAMAQRGAHVLHASAVVVDGGVHAFLADAGWGKSTLAAALHARGHRLVADDVVAILPGEGRPLVAPAFPQLKLWPPAATAVGVDSEALPRVYPEVEKRARRLSPGAFDPTPVPLAGLWVLDAGEAPTAEPLRGGDAVMELVRNSYGLGPRHDLDGPAGLERCARVLETVPAWRLRRPWALDGLNATVALVERTAREPAAVAG